VDDILQQFGTAQKLQIELLFTLGALLWYYKNAERDSIFMSNVAIFMFFLITNPKE